MKLLECKDCEEINISINTPIFERIRTGNGTYRLEILKRDIGHFKVLYGDNFIQVNGGKKWSLEKSSEWAWKIERRAKRILTNGSLLTCLRQWACGDKFGLARARTILPLLAKSC